MEKISLITIEKRGTILEYVFEATGGLSKYFSGNPFFVEFPWDISQVPDAVAAVTFVCNVLPLIWLTNAELVVPELDQRFYECIPNVKKGYETMFPESIFAGKVTVRKIIRCDRLSTGKTAALFSGGVDATQTLISHFDEKPDLISIWGSDIRFDNALGWERTHAGIRRTAQKFALTDVVIRSSFRDFDQEGVLSQEFSKQLQDGWWHGVKHGIGLLGHAAPYAYLNDVSTLYIASSNCPADGPVRCASNPLIDNNVCFVNCNVVHDGFELSRQDKLHNIVKFRRTTGNEVSLRVCWESQSGGNCCHCEKCYRTMAGLLAEGADSADYGFEYAAQTIPKMRENLLNSNAFNSVVAKRHWIHIQKGMLENLEDVQRQKYWKHIRWITRADFHHFETIKPTLFYRIRGCLLRLGFYQILHNPEENL